MLVPKLRFKEFNNEWQQKELKDISNILSGKRIPKGLYAVNYNTGIPYITVSSMGDFFINEKEVQYITKDVEKYILKYKVNTNDIILSVAGTLGKLNVVQKNLSGANLTENCNKITNIDNNSYYLYVYYYLKFCIDKYILLLSTKSSQPKIALDRIRNMTINLPSLEEQTKIANFLSLIDRKIELQEKLVDSLNLYKKGLLLEKFVREGSNRLIEKCIELKDLTEYYTSNLTFQSLMSINNGSYPIYDASGICNYINTYQFNFKYIAIIKDGAGVGRIQLCNEYSSVIGTLGVIKPINCQLEYLYYYLQTVNFKKYIVGTTIPHIYYKDYSDMLVSVPSIEEQIKIANLFTNLDKKIDFETKKLQDLKTYKKGLLQKMFI